MIRWGKIWKVVITQTLCAIAYVTIYELFFRIDYVKKLPDGTIIMSTPRSGSLRDRPCESSSQTR